ncbi:unnamed protein product [Ectocarpus sp. CCAP 1310/34]|nr:unnamed protein product [Ectocarpus sp. CCAP 1310/34]
MAAQGVPFLGGWCTANKLDRGWTADGGARLPMAA